MRPNVTRLTRFVLLLAIAVGAAVLLAGCVAPQVTNITNPNPASIFPPRAVTQQGQATEWLYAITLVIATIVFLIVEGLVILIALRFRRKPTDTDLPRQTHGNNPLEILWTVVPAITVTFLFIAAIATLNEQQTLSPSPAVVVDVEGFQWQWTFKYPNQGNLSFTGAGREGPQMVAPTGENVRIRLTATDVIHSFYVPLFNYKLDAVPGRVNEFDVLIREAGTYGGQCAEFCGLSHGDMFFTVRAVPRAEFDAWVAAEQQKQQQTPQPPPSGGQTITLKSVNITTFDPPALTARANQPIVFDFQNVDTEQPHNVAIENTPAGVWSGTPIAQAGQTATYSAPALPPGEYTFFCAVHATTMRGTLTVQP